MEFIFHFLIKLYFMEAYHSVEKFYLIIQCNFTLSYGKTYIFQYDKSCGKSQKYLTNICYCLFLKIELCLQATSMYFFLNFMRIIYDILFLEAIVPNGLYNIFQINVMKKETVKRYAKKNYYNNGIAYENTVENIKGKV